MSTGRITYNSKTIDVSADEIIIDPFLPKRIHRTLTGAQETVYEPRMDVRITAHFRKHTDAAKRLAVFEWWQWAQQGNSFRYVKDTTKTVKTTLSASEAAGQTVLSVSSTSGFVQGQQYVIVGGPNYQLVQIASIGISDITVTSSLNATFASGSVVRDQYLWDLVLCDANQHTPLENHFNPETDGTWSFSFDAYEDVG